MNWKSLSKYAVNRKSSILATDSPKQSRAPPPIGIRARVEPPPPSRKRSDRDGEKGLYFKAAPAERKAVSAKMECDTWFEAVWLRPNCRIMMGSKKIWDDDCILGDEITCNTNRGSYSCHDVNLF